MHYKNEEIKEDVDIITLSPEEHERLKAIFVSAIQQRYPYKRKEEIKDITRIIVTDALHRAEFVVRKEKY